jgi:hypothetical protein
MSEEIKMLKIDLKKVREFNLSLANENHELWKELNRLNSPLAKERESRISLEFLKAGREAGKSKTKGDMGKRVRTKPITH